ncbi:MAG: hypothetical protein ACYTEL_21340 [Planctomycetota bacterium]|jgi:hypothetical protein
MNSFWPKFIGTVLIVGVVLTVVIAVKALMAPGPPQRTIAEQWAEDDERLRAAPQPNEPATPAESQPDDQNETVVAAKPVEPTEPARPQFRELSEIEEIEAERLFNVAIQHRKMGRLQGIGLRTMVDCCRRIIAKYPDSEYAFKAKRMLADIPERFRARFNITDEEIDLGDWK